MDHYAKFDRHVSRHDADTQLWADGGGAEEAVEHLEKFQDEDWQTLRAAYPGKDRFSISPPGPTTGNTPAY